MKNAKEKNSKKHIFTTSFPCKRNKVGLRMYSSMRTHVCAATQNAGYPGNCGIKKLRLTFSSKASKVHSKISKLGTNWLNKLGLDSNIWFLIPAAHCTTSDRTAGVPVLVAQLSTTHMLGDLACYLSIQFFQGRFRMFMKVQAELTRVW